MVNKPGEYTVGICGFTCFAVYEAIVKEGYKVEYLDIEKKSLNFSLDTLKSAVKNDPKLKIVLIQNTLGYPCDIESILKVCKENNIVLIEDLAHSIGTKYLNGKEGGTVGDFTMLSFSQDKVIDKVSGGALIVRNNQFEISNFKFQKISFAQKLRDKFYPLITYKIRKTYDLGLGKVLHKISKLTNILSKPMDYIDQDNLHHLPTEYAKDIYRQFLLIDTNLFHRKRIAEIYNDTLDKKVLPSKIINTIKNSTNLRFPIFVERRENLINSLKDSNIFVSDIWYDVPIGPRKYLNKTSYKKGSCPNSEITAERLLNLPTHKNVSDENAKYIADKINLWLKSQ